MSEPDSWWYFTKPDAPPPGKKAPPLVPEAVAAWRRLQSSPANRVAIAFNYTLSVLETK